MTWVVVVVVRFETALPKCLGLWGTHREDDFSEEKEARMAQRWPSVSGPARDVRMSRAPARGAPAVSAPEARRSTRASPHAHNSLLPAHGAPRDTLRLRNPDT